MSEVILRDPLNFSSDIGMARLLSISVLVLGVLGFLYRIEEIHIYWDFLIFYSLQFLGFAGLAFLAWRRPSLEGFSFKWILPLAIFLRLVLFTSEPIMETDHYRYLWDGHVQSKGMNPYVYAPSAPELDSLELDLNETQYREWINYPDVPTIYPPVAQVFFLGAHSILPDSELGLRILFTIFDLLTGFLLIVWLRKRAIDPRWSFLYFLNPLVFKEIANSIHLDSIAVFFCALAVYLFETSNRRWGAWAALALAVGTKLYAFALLPFFFVLETQRWRNLLLFLGVLAGFYIPYLDAGWALFGGTNAYVREWYYNASVFQLIFLWAGSEAIAKGVVATIFCLFIAWRLFLLRTSRETIQVTIEAFWALGAILILSPVVDAWYVLWILPFAVLFRNIPWLCFTYLVGMGAYAWLLTRENAHWFRLIEYGVFFTLLVSKPGGSAFQASKGSYTLPGPSRGSSP